jgi:phage-related minor tail protein
LLENLEAQRADLRRAVNVLNFDKGSGTAPAASTPAPFVLPPKPVPKDLQREFDKFIEAGAEARLSAYEKALQNVDDAYGELTKKVIDAGLAANKEREMLHLLEVAREAQQAGIREKSEAEELAIAKMEKAQAVMAGELAILSDTSKSYDQITEALKKFNAETELEIELQKKAKELRDLGVSDSDIQRLIAAQRQLAKATLEARDAHEKLGEKQKEAKALARDVANEFARTASSILFDSTSLINAMDNLARAITEAVVQAAIIKPVSDAIAKGIESGGSGSFADTFAGAIGFFGGLFGAAGAKGVAFNRGSVVPMAKGGILTGPTAFPMRDGKLALGGELDDEAILPLRRLPNGDLGVGAARSREAPQQPPVYMTVKQTIVANDPNAYRSTLGQQATALRRAMDREFSRNG